MNTGCVVVSSLDRHIAKRFATRTVCQAYGCVTLTMQVDARFSLTTPLAAMNGQPTTRGCLQPHGCA